MVNKTKGARQKVSKKSLGYIKVVGTLSLCYCGTKLTKYRKQQAELGKVEIPKR